MTAASLVYYLHENEEGKKNKVAQRVYMSTKL